MTTATATLSFDQARDWYQHRATNMERAGVKIRLYNDYRDELDARRAFVRAVMDEQARRPLP